MSANDNKQAVDNVEQAFMSWGRYRPVLEPRWADLVIMVRKGRSGGPAIGGVGNGGSGPVILQQPGSGQTRVGGQWGLPAPTTQQPQQPGQRTAPMPGAEAGSSQDVFEVFRGQTQYPLDGALRVGSNT